MKVVANRSVSSQEISRHQKQVFIIELTAGHPLPLKLVNCRLDQSKQDRVQVFTPAKERRHDDVVPQIGESLTERFRVPSVGPPVLHRPGVRLEQFKEAGEFRRLVKIKQVAQAQRPPHQGLKGIPSFRGDFVWNLAPGIVEESQNRLAGLSQIRRPKVIGNHCGNVQVITNVDKRLFQIPRVDTHLA